MDSRILEIVFYLMDYLQETHGRVSNLDEVSDDLKGLGYSDEEITRAYSWMMENVHGGTDSIYSAIPMDTESSRIFTALERTLFTPEALAFLVRLASLKIIDPEQFELIVDRVGLLAQQPLTVDQLKVIVSLVAFDELGEIDAEVVFGEDPDVPVSVN